MNSNNSNFIPDCYKKSILVLGCGNILFGDDGFGPAVIEYLEKNYKIPEDVCVMDVGTGVREILFTITISERKPKKIVIVDSVDVGRLPGEIVELSIDNIPRNKVVDFSLHQVPTSNLLRDLKELCKVEVIVIAVQVGNIPKMVKPGISESLVNSIPKVCEMIMKSLI